VRITDELRAADPRVDDVVRAFVLQRLSLSDDDLADDVVEAVLRHVLRSFIGGHYVVGAVRLLARLDAVVARAHPVDLTYHERTADRYAATVTRVPLGDDGLHGVVTAALVDADPDRLVVLAVDDREAASLDVVEAEALAYALLRLVALARDRPREAP
jgi:hypothetical protein